MKKTKPAIVMIYGYRGAALGLEEMRKLLEEDGFEVYVPVIPPFGEGSKLEEYGPEEYAEYLAEWLEKEGLAERRPVVVGHSMGSIVAASLAERHPELIADKLVLLAPIAKKVPMVFRWLSPMVTFLPNRVISYVTTKFLLVYRKKDKKFFREVYELSVACGAECTSRNDDFKAARFSAGWAVSDFKMPQKTLFLIGERDRLTAVEKVRGTAKGYDAEVEVVAEVGHLLNYEKPREVVGMVERFIEG